MASELTAANSLHTLSGAGTTVVKMVDVGGTLFFVANVPTDGATPFKLFHTSGTTFVKSSEHLETLDNLTAVEDALFYTTSVGASLGVLHVANTTTVNTLKVDGTTAAISSAAEFGAIGNKLFFLAGGTRELYRSDPLSSAVVRSTKRLADFGGGVLAPFTVKVLDLESDGVVTLADATRAALFTYSSLGS